MKLIISTAMVAAALGVDKAKAAFPSTVASLMDTNADPCDDFYQYTCGAWISSMDIPDSKKEINHAFSDIQDRNDLVIQEIMKDKPPIVSEFWDSCMDMDTLNSRGNQPLQATFAKIAMAGAKEALFKVAGKVSRTGANMFMSYAISADEKNATTNVLYAEPDEFILPDISYYLDDVFPKYENAYRTYIVKILKLAGVDPHYGTVQLDGEKAGPEYAANTVIGIEMELAQILLNLTDSDDPDLAYNPMSYKDAAAKYPLTFGAYAKGLGFLKHSKLSESSTVILTSLEYFDKVEEFVASLELKDLKVYLTFLYTSDKARYLSDDFAQARFDLFGTALTGTTERAERNTFCVTRETDSFPDLVGQYYFAKMFDTEREESTKLMVKLVEDAMNEHIQKLSWLDAATKAEAEKKLAKLTNLVGHSLQNKTYPFKLDRHAFFDNIHKINQHEFHLELQKLGNPVDRTEWGMGASEVNAYYNPLANQMVFPAGILQPPFFNGSSHPSQNFGAIGAIIGHELTHGFDNSGRLYDGDGNRRSWWTPEISDAFDARAQCLMDQYSSFVVNGEGGSPLDNVDGNLTITENIADNGGLSLAYDAYQKYITSPEAVVPSGTEVSEEEANQLFFVSFGQAFCGKARDGAMEQTLLTDVHSPGQWRINGATMNNDNFAKAFKCKAGSKMNPDKKCVIW